MLKIKILFVCIHNSARSQMAEAFLNHFGDGRFEAQSGGLEPGKLNPIVVEVMAEEGIDISRNKTKKAEDFITRGEKFDYVITVCDETSAERCPVFPGKIKRLHWGFQDPSSLIGSHEEKLQHARVIRDAIKTKVLDFVQEFRIR